MQADVTNTWDDANNPYEEDDGGFGRERQNSMYMTNKLKQRNFDATVGRDYSEDVKVVNKKL